MSLATIDDLNLRLPAPIQPGDKMRAQTLLDDASALVTGFTRQTFTQVTDDQIVLRPVGTLLRLPQRPVNDVSLVVALSGTDTVPDFSLPPGAWTWDGRDTVDVWPLTANTWLSLPESWWELSDTVDTYRVTYDHGYAVVPPEIVAVVAGMVTRVLLSPSPTEGMVSEKIGQYTYQLQQGMGSPGSSSVRLTSADKQTLIDAGYRRTTTTVQVRS